VDPVEAWQYTGFRGLSANISIQNDVNFYNPASGSHGNSPMSDANPREATVLVVDDEQRAAETYATALESIYEVRVAYGGEEALTVIDEHVDVVLLDRRMPEMSGDEVLEAIQREKYDCRVAMVTAVNPDFDILSLGFDDYVVKPVGKEGLNTTVERLLALQEYDDAHQELSALKVKRNVLQLEKPDTELSGNEEFEGVTDRIAELEAKLDTMEAELDLPDGRPR